MDYTKKIARQSREMLRNDLDPLQQERAEKLAVKNAANDPA
ncbi:hypothetical protein [Commensalibacter communis]|nr:hypothetical protein [Commensalibacter communis]